MFIVLLKGIHLKVWTEMGMVVISASLIQHLRALQYTTYLEDWECTSVISANVDKRIPAGFHLGFTVLRYQ